MNNKFIARREVINEARKVNERRLYALLVEKRKCLLARSHYAVIKSTRLVWFGEVY